MKYSEAETYLIAEDPVMADLIKRLHPLEDRTDRGNYFASLSRSIVGQQISVQSATKIYERFKTITKLKPKLVANLSLEQSKQIGLSGQKQRYLKDLAAHFVKNSAVFNHLDTLRDDQVISELTEVKGIGTWSAQMFLIFTLHHPDVFAPDDRGLQIAIENNYKFKAPPTRSQLTAFAERWSPHRTTASLYLWQSLHNT